MLTSVFCYWFFRTNHYIQYNINIGALYWTKEDENCWTYQGCEKDRMNKKSA